VWLRKNAYLKLIKAEQKTHIYTHRENRKSKENFKRKALPCLLSVLFPDDARASLPPGWFT
jgi:hypothetical protein